MSQVESTAANGGSGREEGPFNLFHKPLLGSNGTDKAGPAGPPPGVVPLGGQLGGQPFPPGQSVLLHGLQHEEHNGKVIRGGKGAPYLACTSMHVAFAS